MKAGTHTIEIEAKLILTRRELALLNHICSYDNGAAAKLIAENTKSNHYAGGVSVKEVQDFLSGIRAETQKLMDQIEDAKTKLFKE